MKPLILLLIVLVMLCGCATQEKNDMDLPADCHAIDFDGDGLSSVTACRVNIDGANCIMLIGFYRLALSCDFGGEP